MLKNIIYIIKVMISCIIIMVSPCTYAGIMYIPVELQCGRNFITSLWITFNEHPGVQYVLTTRGLREAEKNGIIEVFEKDGVGTTDSGLRVYVEARCIPQNREINVSLTGNSVTCEMGEGIMIKMFAPNDINPDKYHYMARWEGSSLLRQTTVPFLK